ncbi:MAG: SRPBCC family protein [Ignavibacteria bacterium]|nr:SRPBCC family protein [Ignavibacteria bacterium]MCC7159614.1 SRPBCC family protein [Ignavibacteria bacterium]
MDSAEISQIKDNEMIFTRIINAPRELVFEVWTDPKHLEKWWGPDGFSLSTSEYDLKSGGVWRFIMHGPDGKDFPNRVVFTEVSKPSLLKYRHTGDDETEWIKFEVIITFEDLGNKTRLKMESVFETKEDLQRVNEQYGAFEGGKQHLARLAEHLESLQC